MSILEFVEMDITMCIICSMISLVVCLMYSGIGYLFSAKRGLIFQSVLGMTFVAAIGTICAGFCAAMYKYLIVLFAVIGLIILFYRFHHEKIVPKEIFASLVPTIIMFAIAFVNLMFFVIPKNGVFYYNGHQTYFSGVPLELLQADYFSRIRLMDVYPFEWSKYHFFNGAYISIPLIGFVKKNYISYLLAKMIQIAFYGGALFEAFSQKYNKKKAVMILGTGMSAFFICQFNGITWSIATNNFSCIFMMLLAWLAFEEENYSESVMLSIGYAITKSGSVISGGLLFAFGLYKLYIKNQKSIVSFIKLNYRTAIYAVTVGIGVLSMALIGENAAGESGLLFSLNINWIYSVIANMFRVDWFSLMPLGGVASNSTIYPLRFEFLIIAVYLYLIIKNNGNLRMLLIKYKYTAIVIFVLSLFLLVGGILYLEEAEIALQAYLIWYVLPIVTLFSCLRENMFGVFWIYLASHLFNFVLFNAGVTAPNYSIIAFVILTIFSEQFVIKVYDTSESSYRLVICFLSILSILYSGIWGSPKMFILSQAEEELVLTDVSYSDEPYEYYTAENAYLAKLNALKGNRVHYNVLPICSDETMRNISMAMSFLPSGYEDEFYRQVN